MKKIITMFICFMLLATLIPSTVLATEYASLIDNADLIISEDETSLQSKIDYIKEEYDYNITLVSGDFESKEAFVEYGDTFSEYDSNASGTILLIGEYEEKYNYYSIPYGTYFDSLNDVIFAEFEEFDASSKTYTESYEMYITLVQTFLEEQDKTSEETAPQTSEETSSEETSSGNFDAGIIDEENIFANHPSGEFYMEYFGSKIKHIYKEYNHKITLITKDFDDAQYNSDYEEIKALVEQEKGSGSVIIVAPSESYDFEFVHLHYGEYKDAINDGMFSYNEIRANAGEGEDTVEDLHFVAFDLAVIVIDNILRNENEPSPLEGFENVGSTIAGFDPMIDAAELFTDTEEEQLFARVQKIRDTYDFDVTMITVNKIPYNREDLRDYFDWYEGLDPARDGLVVGVNMDELNREFSISARNFGMEAFTNDAHKVIHKEVPTLLTNGEYFKAFNLFLDYTEQFLQTAKAGEPYNTPIAMSNVVVFVVLVPLGLAYLIAWAIVKFVFVAQMKTAVVKTQATDSMVKGSLVLLENSDRFTHETETRTYDPPSEDKGSGGSSGSRTESDGYGGDRSGSSSSF